MHTLNPSRKLRTLLVKDDGSTIESNEDIAAALGQFFQTTFSEEALDHIPELPERTSNRLSELINWC